MIQITWTSHLQISRTQCYISEPFTDVLAYSTFSGYHNRNRSTLVLIGLNSFNAASLCVIRDLRMELWACGFNAWNQLQFEGDLPEEPEDVLIFKRVLRAEGSIDILETSFSACLGMLTLLWRFLVFFLYLCFHREMEVISRVCHMIRYIDIMSENKMAPASGKSVQRYMLEFHLMLKEG